MNQQAKKGKNQPREKTICFCYNVPEHVIVDAIRSGCKSLMDIRRETYASTGCAGCSEEIKKLLRKHANDVPDPAEGEPEGTPGKVSNG
jgi:NAD(P)H-nitrite reductase large subunit